MRRSVLKVCLIQCVAGWLQTQSADGTATVAGTILDQALQKGLSFSSGPPFNLTKTPVFSAPHDDQRSKFGVITGQSNPARNIQLALKVLF